MLSTRNLTAADLDAVATYLLGDSPPAPTSLAAPNPADVAADANGAGRISYVALCAGCHGLEGYGMNIVEQLPIRAEANPHNERYLETKRAKMGHLL